MQNDTVFNTDGLTTNDSFYRKSFARRLAKVISEQPRGECLVVSISSEWGAGKTNVLHWMHSALAEQKTQTDVADCIPVVDFNPWGVTGERDLLFRLYEKLIKAIDPDDNLLSTWQKAKQKIGKSLSSRGKSIGAIATAAQQPLAGAIIEGTTGVFEALCEVGITEVRKRVEEKLSNSQWRLVVILDDIDRLEREELLVLLRILKREAALPNTTYVLAMDEGQVSKIIGGEGADAELRGRKYLEKIVQVRLQLPSVPPHIMKEFALEHIETALGSEFPLERERFDRVFDVLFLPRIKTPRTAKNLANAIHFACGLLPGEVDVTDLALLECARLLFPELYVRIEQRTHLAPKHYLTIEQIIKPTGDKEPHPSWDWLKQAWNDANLNDATDAEKRALGAWLPQVNAETSIDGEEATWWRSQRLCSTVYHWRYFACAIVRGDIADAEVEELRQLCLSNNSDGQTKLAEALADERGRVVTEKLCRTHYTNDQIVQMVRFLSLCEIDAFDSAQFAARICALSPSADVIENVVSILADEAPLQWTIAFIRSLPRDRFERKSQHDGGKPNAALAKFADRQLDTLSKSQKEDVDTEVEMIWSVWHFGSPDKLKSVITSRLAEDSSFAFVLLACGCGRGAGTTPPRVWHWLGQISLNSLIKIVSLDALKKALSEQNATLPPPYDNPDSPHKYCSPEELVHEFRQTLAAGDIA